MVLKKLVMYCCKISNIASTKIRWIRSNPTGFDLILWWRGTTTSHKSMYEKPCFLLELIYPNDCKHGKGEEKNEDDIGTNCNIKDGEANSMLRSSHPHHRFYLTYYWFQISFDFTKAF